MFLLNLIDVSSGTFADVMDLMGLCFLSFGNVRDVGLSLELA